MAANILEFILCAVESFCFYIFADNLLPKRYKNRAMLPVLATVTSVVVFLIPNFSILKIGILFLIECSGCMLLYRSHLYICSLFSLTVTYLFLIIDIIVGNMLSVIVSQNIIIIFYDNLLHRAIICFIIKVLDILVLFFLYRFYKRAELNYSRKFWILYNIIMFVFLIITIMFMTFYGEDTMDLHHELLYLILSIMFFIMSLIVIYFSTYILVSYGRNNKLMLLESGLAALRENMAIQNEAAENLRKIRHDIKNHLSIVHTLLDEGEISQADKIISDLLSAADNMKIDIQNSSGNTTIDSVISFKAAACRGHRIRFEALIDTLPDIHITSADLSSIITNMIDNAIDATVQVDDPYIQVKILMVRSYLSIFVKNTCNTDQIIYTDRLISTKSNPEKHGYGTRIISDIADKYSGSFTWKAENGYFTANVLLLNKTKTAEKSGSLWKIHM